MTTNEEAVIEDRLQRKFKRGPSVKGRIHAFILITLVLCVTFVALNKLGLLEDGSLFTRAFAVGCLILIVLSCLIAVLDDHLTGQKGMDQEYGEEILAPVLMRCFKDPEIICRMPKDCSTKGYWKMSGGEEAEKRHKGGIDEDFFLTGFIPYSWETQRSIYIRNGKTTDPDHFVYMNLTWYGSDGDSYTKLVQAMVLRVRTEEKVSYALTVNSGSNVRPDKLTGAAGFCREYTLAPKEVRTGNEVFDSCFTVHAMSAHDAFLYLTPELMERLLSLQGKFGAIDVSWHGHFIDVCLPASYAILHLPDPENENDLYHISFSAAEVNVESLLNWVSAIRKDLRIS